MDATVRRSPEVEHQQEGLLGDAGDVNEEQLPRNRVRGQSKVYALGYAIKPLTQLPTGFIAIALNLI
ncbi:MAG: hypothetical protein ACI8XC_001827 [Gammaproteobacteria bacterium]|jgi:hypothetical protein